MCICKMVINHTASQWENLLSGHRETLYAEDLELYPLMKTSKNMGVIVNVEKFTLLIVELSSQALICERVLIE